MDAGRRSGHGHWFLIGALLMGAVGWALFQTRSDAPDPLLARDRLVGGPAVVADFTARDGDGAYRLIAIRDRGWVWERLAEDGPVEADAILYNGSQQLLRVAEACYVPLDNAGLPLVPGLTTAHRLRDLEGRTAHEDGTHSYDIWPEPFEVGEGALSTSQLITVVEDLSRIGKGELGATASPRVPGIQPLAVVFGSYKIRRASGEERQRAEALLKAARPSDVAALTVTEEVRMRFGDWFRRGPFTILVPRDCPERAVQLLGGARGGQQADVRWIASRLPIDPERPPVTSRTYSLNPPVDGVFAIEVLSCTGADWFPC